MCCESLCQFGEQVTNNHPSFFPVHTFGQHHDNRIIACNRTKECRVLDVIDIIGNHTGMTWRSVYYHKVSGEIKAPLRLVDFFQCRHRFELAFTRQRINAKAAAYSNFTDTQLFEVATQRGLCTDKAFFFQCGEQLFLTLQAVHADNLADCLHPRLLVLLHLHNIICILRVSECKDTTFYANKHNFSRIICTFLRNFLHTGYESHAYFAI